MNRRDLRGDLPAFAGNWGDFGGDSAFPGAFRARRNERSITEPAGRPDRAEADKLGYPFGGKGIWLPVVDAFRTVAAQDGGLSNYSFRRLN